jgi:FixJ family two-component response regulator
MSQTTVFIIDDDPSARQGLSRLMNAAGINAESFASAKDFLESGKYQIPGCIILDVKMPDMTGPELQDELVKTGIEMPIIFLSGHADVPTTASTMKKGAVNFLTKPVDSEDLLEAIRESLSRDEAIRTDHEELNIINDKIKALTPREYEIMTYVITGMLNKQIAAELNISIETIKIHRGRVMHKLGIVSVAELARLCENAGIAPAQPSNL